MCNSELSDAIILIQPLCSTSRVRKKKKKCYGEIPDQLLPKLPSIDANSLYQGFCVSLQLPHIDLWKYWAYLDKKMLISLNWEKKKATRPRPNTYLCDQNYMWGKLPKQKIEPSRKTQQLIPSLPQSLPCTMKYLKTWHFISLLYYIILLYTQVSLSQKANLAVVSKEIM